MKYFYILILSLIPIFCFGQLDSIERIITSPVDTTMRVQLISKYTENGMKLRWAPNNEDSWMQGNINGYVLKKYGFDQEGDIIPEPLDSIVLKPWAYEKFESEQETLSDTILGVAECIYAVREMDNSSDLAGSAIELRNRYNLAVYMCDLSFKAAEVAALGYLDTKVITGEKYFYVVEIIDQVTTSPGFKTVTAESTETPSLYIKYAYQKDSSILLLWDKELYKPYYTAYHVEASVDGINYQPVNTSPIVGMDSKEYPSNFISYNVRVPNYEPKYYRIYGLTPFGDRSEYSPAVQLIAKDKKPCNRIEEVTIETNSETREALIKWDAINCNDLKGYQVFIGSSPHDQFEPVSEIIESPQFAYTVDNAYTQHFFIVATIDTAMNASFSGARYAPFRDTLPPAMPTGLEGSVDSNGVVTLTWDKGPEMDISGYYLHRANSKFHVFTPINPRGVNDTIYHDTITLKTHTEKIYYQLTAMDFYGHMSEMSEKLMLKRPDTIPPFPPYLIEHKQSSAGISTEWGASSSKDVAQYILSRKADQGEWIQLKIWNVTPHEDDTYPEYDYRAVGKFKFVDTSIDYGSYYTYRLIAVDDSELSSVDHAQISMKYVDKRLPQQVRITECRKDENNHVSLVWEDENNSENIQQYIIYRAKEDGKLLVLERIEGGNKFIDKGTQADTTYSYAIKVLNTEGKKSKFSNIEKTKI